MLTRIVTAACLLPVVAAVYLGPAWLFLVLATAATLLATSETAKLHEAKGARPLVAAALAGSALCCLSFFDPVHLPLGMALAASVALAVGLQGVIRLSLDQALPDLAATISCIAYPGLLLAFQVGLRTLPADSTRIHDAPGLLLFLYCVVFGNDAFAYFTGKALGRVKLAPQISPGKTVEGFIGGIVGGVALGVACTRLLPCGLSLGESAGFGALIAVAAVFGDLSKSMLKRSANVKDSGRLLPGHGGVLDRLDGLLLAGPLLYFLVTRVPVAASDSLLLGAP
jgi:phosphatidate cytidylyltransferase